MVMVVMVVMVVRRLYGSA